MSHKEQLNYVKSVKDLFPGQFANSKVLEVGSLNINGSVRSFFEGCEYTGIDIGEGSGVDLVVGGHEYDAPTSSFDTVISCECFEHNPYWLETFVNMYRLCKPGGLIVMTCATIGRPEHGTTRSSPASSPLTLDWDYYKNLTEEDFTSRLDFPNLFSGYSFSVQWGCRDLDFYGIKKKMSSRGN